MIKRKKGKQVKWAEETDFIRLERIADARYAIHKHYLSVEPELRHLEAIMAVRKDFQAQRAMKWLRMGG